MRLVGKIKEAHGLRGELYVLIFSGDLSWLPRLKEFGLGECPSPGEEPSEDAVQQTMTCQKVKPFKNGIILKAAELGDRTAAEKVEKLGFYVPDDFFVSEDGEGIYLDEIEGFKIKDANDKTLGTITDFSSNGAQDLLVVSSPDGSKTFEVPFVDDFLLKIDFKSQIVKMDLPEGLIDLDDNAPADDGDEDEEDSE
ncbi:MAG: 16S rRNA processing protein RimM [Bdellovibrionaceae bacterium]|nr:16S rRNA processing protein RimM [Pseudobdellovibrionaceae bacterium]